MTQHPDQEGPQPNSGGSTLVAEGPDDEHINDDERKKLDWKTRWPEEVRGEIRRDALYVAGIFLFAVICIFLNWRGDFFTIGGYGCDNCNPRTLSRYVYLFFSGMLGASLFGLKYLYKVVARGYWNQDRFLWRVFSPWLGGGIAFGVGAMADAGLLGFSVAADRPSASFVALGFIAGYFADSASRKLQEIADTLFGTHVTKK